MPGSKLRASDHRGSVPVSPNFETFDSDPKGPGRDAQPVSGVPGFPASFSMPSLTSFPSNHPAVPDQNSLSSRASQPQSRPGDVAVASSVGGSALPISSLLNSSLPSSTAGSSAPRSDSDLVRRAREQARGRGNRGKAAAQLPPDAFPGYQIIREIHRGGQGVVYQAVHLSTKRKVAVKVMREGPLSGPKEIVRFEREIEILSALSHPNIVSIHDSGHTHVAGPGGAAGGSAGGGPGSGLPFFVMDYVSGTSLSSWTQDAIRPIDEVLVLFAKICEAVNAAHLRGVIHRDLKPGNIRVDANNEPHILDFGLAKSSLHEHLGQGAHAAMTRTGQFLGSLQWASPEQAEGNLSAIDVRTDVYSLGVILYEMLTGEFPYPVNGTNRETLENIVKATPTRPSSIGTRSNGKINNEVETIILKCLSKERERRYQNAGDVARDIRHYLAGEPIEAKRDSGWYVLRKKLRRHRVPAALAGVLSLTVLVSAVLTTILWRSADVNLGKSRVAEAAAVANAAIARGSEAAAIREKQRAQRSQDFLAGMFNLLDPDVARASNTTIVADMLRDAGSVIDRELRDDLDVAAAMRDTVGMAFFKIGRYALANDHLTRALEWRRANLPANDLAIAQSLLHHAQVLNELKRPEDLAAARREAAEALGIFQAIAGSRSESAAACFAELAYNWKQERQFEQAEAQYKAALNIRSEIANTLGGTKDLEATSKVAETLASMGEMYRDQRKFDLAIDALERSLALRILHAKDRPTAVATAKQSLAAFLSDRGRTPQARPDDLARAGTLFQDAIDILTPIVDDRHPFLSATRNKLGVYLNQQNEPAKAERVLLESLSARLTMLGEHHTYVAATRMNLARAYRGQGKFNEALALLSTTIASLDRQDTNYPVAQCKWVETASAAARDHASHGRQPEAVQLTGKARELFLTALAGNPKPDQFHVGRAVDELVLALRQTNQTDQAEATLALDYQSFRQSQGAEGTQTKAAASRLAAFYQAVGNAERQAIYDRAAK